MPIADSRSSGPLRGCAIHSPIQSAGNRRRKRMSNEKDKAGGRTGDYEVGYGKPPKHGQFQAGRSGNPSGRPKAVRNLLTDVKRTLKVPIQVKAGGRSRKISTQEGALMLLREKALKGEARALDRLLDLASRFNNEPGGVEGAQALSKDDRAILTAYAAEIATAPMSPTTFGSSEHRGGTSVPSPDKKIAK